ncbi:MAG TPA: FtsW/RodA/SpoVE family cell cycle protein [Candidatus Angelobacter sp.]|nr:FtsW/RodA/SpoVE family cell cycle protein [Candidatus Angelobacter sp.]
MGNEFFKKLDTSILYILAAFCLISVLAIHGVQHTGLYGHQKLGFKQGINYIIGAVLLFLFAYLDSDQIERLAWPLYVCGFLAVAVLPVLPSSIVPSILGAKRWIQIPLLGTLQPSEFMKVFLLILNSHIAVKHNSTYITRTTRSDFLLIGKILLATLPLTLFVYKEPDTGMPLLFLAGCIAIIILSGIQKKVVLPLTLIPIGLVMALIYLYFADPSLLFHKLLPLLSPHQQARILGWLSPSGHGAAAYQTGQSLLAVGSGEMTGKGFGQGNVYIPEKNSDFIFAAIAEEGGFFAATAVVTLFFLLLYRVTIIGQMTKSSIGSYLCSGTLIIFTLQIFQNIGMTVGLMPVKGISLPFLSYGGSSIFSNMILMGIILSIRKDYQKYMFS